MPEVDGGDAGIGGVAVDESSPTRRAAEIIVKLVASVAARGVRQNRRADLGALLEERLERGVEVREIGVFRRWFWAFPAGMKPIGG
jgi:hypothetical protein